MRRRPPSQPREALYYVVGRPASTRSSRPIPLRGTLARWLARLLQLANSPDGVGEFFCVGVPETLELRRVEVLDRSLDRRHGGDESRIACRGARGLAKLGDDRLGRAGGRLQSRPLEKDGVVSG